MLIFYQQDNKRIKKIIALNFYVGRNKLNSKMFKTGQKVVCINAKGTTHLKENEIYTVIGFHENYPDAVLLAEGKNDVGRKGFWQWRFREIDDKWAEKLLCKLIEEINADELVDA